MNDKIIASGLPLATLFMLCVEVFNLVQIAKNQAVDLRKLNLRLNIEKCRLWAWGQAMGLTQSLPPSSPKLLDSHPFPEIIEESLGLILHLFNDSDNLRIKYGCRKLQQDDEPLALPGTDNPGPIERLSTAFDNFKLRNASKMKQSKIIQKSFWIISDRQKFQNLILEAKSLIDGLQDITKDIVSLVGQDRILRSRITTINDVETLDMVAEVCEREHPRLSDAASTKAEAISLSTTFRRNISEWADTVEDSNSDTETIAAIESLTATELKHKLFSLIKSRGDGVLTTESKFDSYQNVFVLLLSWLERTDGPYEQEEVTSLETLFREKFRYKTVRKTFTGDARRVAQAQINQYLADFVREHGDPNTLLIIYYIGPAKLGELKGDLTLLGRPRVSHNYNELHPILWSLTENNIKDTKSDIFVILDCCHASVLETNFYTNSTTFTSRAFEFLVAAKKNSGGSSPHSFISALVWSLSRLLDTQNSFSTQKLFSTLQDEAPNITAGQSLRLFQREYASSRNIVLAPLLSSPTSEEIETRRRMTKMTVVEDSG